MSPLLFRRLWLHILPRRRKQLLLLFVLMLFASLAEAISIGTVLPFLGVLISPEVVFLHPLGQSLLKKFEITHSSQLQLILTTIFVLGAFFSGGMRLVLLWLQSRLGFAIGADFSGQIYKRTLYQPYTVHIARNSSEVIAGVSSKTGSVIGSTLLPLLSVFSSLLLLVTILLTLIAINPIVALIAFGGLGGIYGLIIVFTRKRLTKDGLKISRETGRVFKAVQEGLGGIRDVLIDGTQSTYYKIYQDADLPLRRSQANIQFVGGSPRFLVEALGITLIAILAYKLTRLGEGAVSAIPVLGALAVGVQRLLPVLQQLYNSWTAVRAGEPSLRDVLNLLDQPLPEYLEKPIQNPIRFANDVKLNQVHFRYSDNTPWVLQGINLQIHKGDRIGLIGTTGSGKSTLLDIFMGLLQPTHGGIEVDGVTITPHNCSSWQSHIAHVPQAIFLADTTIAENIAFGVPYEKIDLERVMKAAHNAKIGATIESWSEGYNTFVGERGVRLSGGQRQRIGIARALYKQADVIVLDEATSALDTNTELEIMNSIDCFGRDVTILIVAHRLTTLKNCDLIYELEHGRVKKTLTPEEVLLISASKTNVM